MGKRVWVSAFVLLSLILPAYAFAQVPFYTEDFSAGLPGDWSVVDNQGLGTVWVDSNPAGRTGFTNLTAPFMIADSDWFYYAANTDLISDAIDCSDFSNVHLVLCRFSLKWTEAVFC